MGSSKRLANRRKMTLNRASANGAGPASTPDGPMIAEALTSALSEPIDPNEIETADRSIAVIDPSIEAFDPSIEAADRARQSDLG